MRHWSRLGKEAIVEKVRFQIPTVSPLFEELRNYMQPRPHHSGSILGPFWGPPDPQSIFSLSHRDADAEVTLDPGQISSFAVLHLSSPLLRSSCLLHKHRIRLYGGKRICWRVRDLPNARLVQVSSFDLQTGTVYEDSISRVLDWGPMLVHSASTLRGSTQTGQDAD